MTAEWNIEKAGAFTNMESPGLSDESVSRKDNWMNGAGLFTCAFYK